MIQLIALGHLGADAEVKTINEKQYISFRIASTERRNEQDETTWISVLVSHNEKLLPYLKKGQQVYVQGRMKAGIYQSNNNIGLDISVFASTLQLCGGKKDENQQSKQQQSLSNGSTMQTAVYPSTGNGVTNQTVAQEPFPPAMPDDDSGLPF